MGRKVVILAAGSRGDLQPCVALGRGLADRDDEVRIVASGRYEQLITGAGLGFFPLSIDPSEIVTSEEGQELLNGGRNPVSFVRNMKRIIRPIADRMLTEIQKGCDGADLVIGPTLGYLGAHIGEYLGIPHALIHFQPSQPTGAFPHPFVPQARFLGPLGNRLSFDAIDTVAWMLGRTFINPWREDGLKLQKSSFRGPIPAARHAPVLCAFSSSVVRRPKDWGKNVHMTGFWFLEQPYWEPPAELKAFLDDGPPRSTSASAACPPRTQKPPTSSSGRPCAAQASGACSWVTPRRPRRTCSPSGTSRTAGSSPAWPRSSTTAAPAPRPRGSAQESPPSSAPSSATSPSGRTGFTPWAPVLRLSPSTGRTSKS